MKRDIGRLEEDNFDILVIGGGINGCAIARDAALRGARVALIEKGDFAAGASGKTTKLIHGGIRYLEQFNFKLVYEALRERAILLRTVPQLIRPIEFIIPVYKDDSRSLLKIRTGVFIYDRMAGRDNIRCHRSLKRAELLTLERNIEPGKLEGGVIYCDAQMDDIRLCLDNALDAYNVGCVMANKVKAMAFIKEREKISGVEARNTLTGQDLSIRAKVTLNATGAWSNGIVKMDDPEAMQITRPTKGIHIVYKKLPQKRAILFFAHRDKRPFFIIPWRGATLIGTTDTDYTDSADEVYASPDDIDYLLEETRRVFPAENIDRGGIVTTFAGLRPLVNPAPSPFRIPFLRRCGVNTQNRPAWHMSREHLISESPSGLISVIGGKYTTYRRLAEEVVDAALSKFPDRKFKRCVTQEVGPPSSLAVEGAVLRRSIEQAVNEEMANTLSDLLFRRLELATAPSLGLDLLEECSRIMAQLLGWTAGREESEMRLYKEEVIKNRIGL